MKFNLLLFFLVYSLQFGSALACTTNVFESSDHHLSCMKSHNLSQALSKNIKLQNNLLKSCPKCKGPSLNLKNYPQFFRNKHMAVAYSENSFGGFNLYVIVRDDPSLCKVWFYQVNENDYQTRQISCEKPVPEMAATLSKLQAQNKYWKK